MPCTPWRSTSSATRNASTIDVPFSSTDSSRLFGITISVSTCLASSVTPSSAWRARRVPSKPNGLVTMPTVSAPISRAIRATTGAAPVPVPPPDPAATNTMSDPFSRALDAVVVVDRRSVADLRVRARAQAARDLGADVQRDVRGALLERLQVGVDGDELDALDARLDHPVDGVHACAADADHAQHGLVHLRRGEIRGSSRGRYSRCVPPGRSSTSCGMSCAKAALRRSFGLGTAVGLLGTGSSDRCA